jgi:hypothetical protein
MERNTNQSEWARVFSEFGKTHLRHWFQEGTGDADKVNTDDGAKQSKLINQNLNRNVLIATTLHFIATTYRSQRCDEYRGPFAQYSQLYNASRDSHNCWFNDGNGKNINKNKPKKYEPEAQVSPVAHA